MPVVRNLPWMSSAPIGDAFSDSDDNAGPPRSYSAETWLKSLDFGKARASEVDAEWPEFAGFCSCPRLQSYSPFHRLARFAPFLRFHPDNLSQRYGRFPTECQQDPARPLSFGNLCRNELAYA